MDRPTPPDLTTWLQQAIAAEVLATDEALDLSALFGRIKATPGQVWAGLQTLDATGNELATLLLRCAGLPVTAKPSPPPAKADSTSTRSRRKTAATSFVRARKR